MKPSRSLASKQNGRLTRTKQGVTDTSKLTEEEQEQQEQQQQQRRRHQGQEQEQENEREEQVN